MDGGVLSGIAPVDADTAASDVEKSDSGLLSSLPGLFRCRADTPPAAGLTALQKSAICCKMLLGTTSIGWVKAATLLCRSDRRRRTLAATVSLASLLVLTSPETGNAVRELSAVLFAACTACDAFCAARPAFATGCRGVSIPPALQPESQRARHACQEQTCRIQQKPRLHACANLWGQNAALTSCSVDVKVSIRTSTRTETLALDLRPWIQPYRSVRSTWLVIVETDGGRDPSPDLKP